MTQQANVHFNLPELPRPSGAERGNEARETAKKTARQAEFRLSQELATDVQEKLKSKASAIASFIETHRNYNSGDWRKWNEDFATALGIEGNPQAYIRGIQEVVYRAEELKGDSGARPDGKIGPYTLAAIAQYTKISTNSVLPDAGRNPRLASKVGAVREADYTAMEQMRQNKDTLFNDYMALMEGARRLTGDYESLGVNRELFMTHIDDVIGFSGGHLNSTNLEDWKDAFIQAGLSQDQLRQLGMRLEEFTAEPEKIVNNPETQVSTELSSLGEYEDGFTNAFPEATQSLGGRLAQVVDYYPAVTTDLSNRDLWMSAMRASGMSDEDIADMGIAGTSRVEEAPNT